MFSRNLYLVHVLLRDFSYSTALLGWAYLAGIGVGLLPLVLTLGSMRLVEVLFFMPTSHRLALRHNPKLLIGVSLIFQIAYVCSFALASANAWFLILTVLLLSAFDVLYWPARDNIERTIGGGTLSSRVGLSRAFSVIGHALGYTTAGIFLTNSGTDAFLWASIGIGLSFIPILLMHVPFTRITTHRPFFKTMFLHTKALQFLTLPVVVLIGSSSVVREVTDHLLPIAMAFANISIIDIGYLLSIFVVCHFAADIVAGYVNTKHRHTLFVLFGFATLCLFLSFTILPPHLLATLYIILAVLTGPFFTITDMYVYAYIRRLIPDVSGGYFVEFVDDSARAIPYIVILLYPLIMTASLLVPGSALMGASATAINVLAGAGRPKHTN